VASESDFDELVENPANGSGYAFMGGSFPAWPRTVRILKWAKALFRASGVIAATDRLQEWIFGNVTKQKDWRINVTNGEFSIEHNSGTDLAPVWDQLAIFNTGFFLSFAPMTTGAIAGTKVTLSGVGGIALDAGAQKIVNISEVVAATVTVLNQLQMSGLPIVNAGAITATTYNGFTLGGAVVPQPVGAANTAGVLTTFARTDHAHRGVHELDVDGAGDLANDVNLVSFDRIQITRAGQDVRFAWNPRKQHVKNSAGADQTPVAGNTETDVTGLTAIAITGADGARTFRVSAMLSVVATGATAVSMTVYVGAAGNLSDGAGARVARFWDYITGAETETLVIPEFEITPAAAAKIGLSIHFHTGAVTGTVKRIAPDQGHLSLNHV
jgi:hypothetical protein